MRGGACFQPLNGQFTTLNLGLHKVSRPVRGERSGPSQVFPEDVHMLTVSLLPRYILEIFKANIDVPFPTFVF